MSAPTCSIRATAWIKVFAHFDDDLKESVGGRGAVERKGGETTDLAIEWLEQHRDEKGVPVSPLLRIPTGDYDPPGLWGERFADRPYLGENRLHRRVHRPGHSEAQGFGHLRFDVGNRDQRSR